MNRIEKLVYNLVKKYPGLKNFSRDLYQLIFSLKPTKRKDSEYEIKEREGYFFGFHDKVPWSEDNKKLLAHKFDIENRKIKKGDTVEIGYFHGDNFMKFKPLAETEAWNWQQGSMLQWLKKEEIIFNYWNGNKNVAKVIDLDGNCIYQLPCPIGAVSHDGRYVLGYSFTRLNRGMPGYGYANENDKNKNILAPQNAGLYLMDIETKKMEMLFSINEIKNFKPVSSMKDAYHFFTHCLFSFDDSRFLFLHRWKRKGERLYSRLIACDIDGGNIHVFPTNGMVSHFTWIDEGKVFAYANTADDGDAYYIFKDKEASYYKISNKLYNSDGHPQYLPKNDLIVTDTYPDKYRIQKLSIFDIPGKEKNIIAKLKSPLGYKNEIRCDLHPRWDREGKMICFDSAHTGKRSLCTLKLK
ncbi:MAG: hypothetical protein ACOCZT_02375 [Halanaerobiales bacterium]